MKRPHWLILQYCCLLIYLLRRHYFHVQSWDILSGMNWNILWSFLFSKHCNSTSEVSSFFQDILSLILWKMHGIFIGLRKYSRLTIQCWDWFQWEVAILLMRKSMVLTRLLFRIIYPFSDVSPFMYFSLSSVLYLFLPYYPENVPTLP